MADLSGILDAMKGAAVMVVGDLMLDRFVYGDTNRISPEAPIPVLSISRETRMLGGAGNVVSNLSGLGVKAHVFAITGNDEDGEAVREIAASMGADSSGILIDETRPTTIKTRFVASNQQLLRTDFEKTHPLDSALQEKLISMIKVTLPKVRVVVLSDYGKGILSRDLIAHIITLAKAAKIPVLVDPKGRDFTVYKGADIVTPNRKELSESTNGHATGTDGDVVAAAHKIIEECSIDAVLATRSEDGMSLVSKTSNPVHLRTQVREVFDVSGAGDTVIATVAASLAADSSLEDAARLANIAGGIVVGKAGTTPVYKQELLDAVKGQGDGSRHRQLAPVIQDWDNARRMVDDWKAKGFSVGFTNGCFDILHYGHVNYLGHARDRCDKLVVALNRDVSVKLLKGPSRPVNDETARATVIGALGAVDMVVFFGAQNLGEDNTPCAIIESLRPDVIFKGGDYRLEDLPEAKVAMSYGGRVEIMNLYEGYSTTSTIIKIKESV